MSREKNLIIFVLSMLLIFSVLLSACGQAETATEAPDVEEVVTEETVDEVE